jgi:hypothetical protein
MHTGTCYTFLSDRMYFDPSLRIIDPDPGLFLKFTFQLLVKLDTDSNYVF